LAGPAKAGGTAIKSALNSHISLRRLPLVKATANKAYRRENHVEQDLAQSGEGR